MNNIVTTLFEVESEAYQAFTDLRGCLRGAGYLVGEAVLLKSDGSQIKTIDAIDTGITTVDDTAAGVLVGTMAGVIGGPLGMLLGAGVGALAGGALDVYDANADASLIERVATKLYANETAIIALVEEESEVALDTLFNRYACTIIREDAANVAEEVEQARDMEKELQRQAKAKMRAEKKEERKAKIEDHKASIEAHFEKIKAKHEADRSELAEGMQDAEAEAAHAKDKIFGN